MMVQHPKGENAIEGSKLVAIELYEIYADELAAHPVAHPGSLDIRIANFGEYLRRVYTQTSKDLFSLSERSYPRRRD